MFFKPSLKIILHLCSNPSLIILYLAIFNGPGLISDAMAYLTLKYFNAFIVVKAWSQPTSKSVFESLAKLARNVILSLSVCFINKWF